MKLPEEEQRAVWIQEQHELAAQVVVLPDDELATSTRRRTERLSKMPLANEQAKYYGGVDVSFPHDQNDQSVAVYVILDAKTLQVVYKDWEYFDLTVPYIPSFLAFREIDPLDRLVKHQCKTKPELTPTAILVDGNGVLHSRGAGIACFLGVRTGVSTIGIGKTLFCEGGLTKELVAKGVDDSVLHAVSTQEVSDEPYIWIDQSPIVGKDTGIHDNEVSSIDRAALIQTMDPKNCHGLAIPLQAKDGRVLACALVGHGGKAIPNKKKTCGSKNAIFVSVGHQISLQNAVQIAASVSKSRIPEPVRQADLLGREMFRNRPKKNSLD